MFFTCQSPLSKHKDSGGDTDTWLLKLLQTGDIAKPIWSEKVPPLKINRRNRTSEKRLR